MLKVVPLMASGGCVCVYVCVCVCKQACVRVLMGVCVYVWGFVQRKVTEQGPPHTPFNI
jgi:hypothetical protein